MDVFRGDWPRVADYIRAELARRHWTQLDLADQAEVSPRYVSHLLSGRPQRITPNTARVERALEWEPGTIRRVVLGEQTSVGTWDEPADEPVGPVLHNETERQIWNLAGLSETTRLELIAYLRARQQLESESG